MTENNRSSTWTNRNTKNGFKTLITLLLGWIEPNQKQNQWKRQKEMRNRKKTEKRQKKRRKKTKKEKRKKKSNKRNLGPIETRQMVSNTYYVLVWLDWTKTKTKMNGGGQKE
jgi:hypothetical protein